MFVEHGRSLYMTKQINGVQNKYFMKNLVAMK